jgi:RraA family protein
MTDMTFDELRRRLCKLDTACLCDANKEIRVLDPGIRPLRPDLKLMGRAHTVSCCDDFLTVVTALRDATAGEVLVVDGQGGHRALAGELFTMEAARKGLAGLVIDGSVRDTETVCSLPIPVYSRHVYPNAGTTLRVFETQIPVKCGGVTVNPGDVLFGDQDGIIVASASELNELIPAAERIQQTEENVLLSMSRGTSLFDMLNLDEHLEKVASKQESRLQFTL